MSREAIENTISEMRSVYDRSTDARFAYYVNRADIKDWADTIEKNVFAILAENERLKAALHHVKEAYVPEYSSTCEWYNLAEKVRMAQKIIGESARKPNALALGVRQRLATE